MGDQPRAAALAALLCCAACGDDDGGDAKQAGEHDVSDVVLSLGEFEWNADPTANEPPAAVQINIGSGNVARAAHVWAEYHPSVDFKCQLRGTKIWAVDPVPNEPAATVTPLQWNRAQLLGFFQGVAGTFTFDDSDVDDAEARVVPTAAHPGCFRISWRAEFEKTGAKVSFTPPLPGNANVVAAPPFEAQLDNDMDDEINGLVEICCCTWDKSVPELQDRDPWDERSERTQDDVQVDHVRVAETREDILANYGVDWTATLVAPPGVRTHGDANTIWRGTYELKQCMYTSVTATPPGGGGGQQTRRKKNGDYDPRDEASDARNEDIGGL